MGKIYKFDILQLDVLGEDDKPKPEEVSADNIEILKNLINAYSLSGTKIRVFSKDFNFEIPVSNIMNANDIEDLFPNVLNFDTINNNVKENLIELETNKLSQEPISISNKSSNKEKTNFIPYFETKNKKPIEKIFKYNGLKFKIIGDKTYVYDWKEYKGEWKIDSEKGNEKLLVKDWIEVKNEIEDEKL